jgi:hypothetical protein
MANALSGTAGSVVYMTGGTTTVGSIAEWSLDLSHSPVETTAFGDVWQNYIPSLRNATGSFSGNFYDGDTAQGNLISSMLAGSAVAFRLYVSGSKYFNVGTAYLTGHGPSISNDGKAETSFDFQVSGPVTFV